MGKYDLLYAYLKQKTEVSLELSFKEVESIIGFKLPKSAYSYTAWWSNSKTKAHPYSHAWLDAGYRTIDVSTNLGRQVVTLKKV